LAQESPAPTTYPAVEPELGWDELTELALRRNPRMTLARETAVAARESAAAWRGLPNPTLQIVPGFSGTAAAKDEELLLSQPLDLFGQRRAERRAAEARSRTALAGRTLAERQLIVTVKTAATTLYAAQEAETLAGEQREIAARVLKAARRRSELGEVPAVQAQRAEVELARTDNELSAASGARLEKMAVLNLLIGRAPETTLKVKAPLEPTEDVRERGRYLLALESRPDIEMARAELDARRASAEAVGRRRWPEVELQVRRDTVTRGGGSTALRAAVTLPVLDLGSLSHSKKAAAAETRAQEARIAGLRAEAAAQLEIAQLKLNQRRSAAERYRNVLVPQTMDLLRKTQIGFEQGASSYLEVLEAQRTARQVQGEYLQATMGLRLEELALEAAVGGGASSTSILTVNP
jgi:cobalt-zinc-cadmium efflux system outer membrane protein